MRSVVQEYDRAGPEQARAITKSLPRGLGEHEETDPRQTEQHHDDTDVVGDDSDPLDGRFGKKTEAEEQLVPVMIATADQRQRASAILPQAEMVYFEMGDETRGRELIVEALMNKDVHDRERFNSLRKCAQEAMSKGHRDKAIEWYAMLEKLPFNKQQAFCALEMAIIL